MINVISTSLFVLNLLSLAFFLATKRRSALAFAALLSLTILILAIASPSTENVVKTIISSLFTLFTFLLFKQQRRAENLVEMYEEFAKLHNTGKDTRAIRKKIESYASSLSSREKKRFKLWWDLKDVKKASDEGEKEED